MLVGDSVILHRVNWPSSVFSGEWQLLGILVASYESITFLANYSTHIFFYIYYRLYKTYNNGGSISVYSIDDANLVLY